MRGRVLAHHLIWTGYGHWLPNDPRGSGSRSLFKDELQQLGAIHFGRKSVQPRRSDVREFYGHADELLEHPRIQFTSEMIGVIAAAFGMTIPKASLHLLRLCGPAGSLPSRDPRSSRQRGIHDRRIAEG